MAVLNKNSVQVGIGVDLIAICRHVFGNAGYASTRVVRRPLGSFNDEGFGSEVIEIDRANKLLVPALNVNGDEIEVLAETVDSAEREPQSPNESAVLGIRLAKSRKSMRFKDVEIGLAVLNADAAVYDFIPRPNPSENIAEAGIRLDANARRSVAIKPIGITRHLGMIRADVEIAYGTVTEKKSKDSIFAALGKGKTALKELE